MENNDFTGNINNFYSKSHYNISKNDNLRLNKNIENYKYSTFRGNDRSFYLNDLKLPVNNNYEMRKEKMMTRPRYNGKEVKPW